MREQLIHIFDESTCLTQKQMKDYVGGIMSNDEAHAAQVHLNSCPLCNDATEGLMAHKHEDIVESLSALNGDFLQEHYSITNPHIHLNAISHAHTAQAGHNYRRKKKVLPFSTHIAIAASLLFCLAVIWYFRQGNTQQAEHGIAANTATIPATDHAAEAAKAQQEVTLQNAPASVMPQPKEPGPDEPGAQRNETVKVPLVAGNAADTEPAVTNNIAKEPRKEEAMGAAPRVAAKAAFAPPKTEKMSALPAKDTREPQIETETAKKADEPDYKVDKLEIGDALYKQNKYEKALVAYRQAMKSEDAEMRAQASFKAAKCYLELGQEDKAKSILEKLVNDDGPQKKEAKRLLRKMR